MAVAQRILSFISGSIREYVPVIASTGVANSGAIPALNAAASSGIVLPNGGAMRQQRPRPSPQSASCKSRLLNTARLNQEGGCMTYIPPRSPTSAPQSQGPLPGAAQSGDQVLVFRPGSGTYYVNLMSLMGTSAVTNRLTLRDGSFLALRSGGYLTHR